MRLYPKKLRNIGDLEREKKRLLKKCRELEENGIFSSRGKTKDKQTAGDGEPGGSLFDILSFSGPVMELLVSFLRGRMKKNSRKNKEKYDDEEQPSKGRKNWLKAVAFELLGGYLKWKAIELSYKALKRVLNRRNGETGE